MKIEKYLTFLLNISYMSQQESCNKL